MPLSPADAFRRSVLCYLDSIARQLVRVSGSEDDIVRQIGGNDLGDDIAVGDAHNETVLGRFVFVLVLQCTQTKKQDDE